MEECEKFVKTLFLKSCQFQMVSCVSIHVFFYIVPVLFKLFENIFSMVCFFIF